MTLTTDWIVPISIGILASFIAFLTHSPKPVPIRIKTDRKRK
jgi:hypothetical protein